MPKKTIILRIDEEMAARAQATTKTLGVSLNAVVSNELRRLVAEQDVTLRDASGVEVPRPYRQLYIRLPWNVLGRFMTRATKLGMPTRILMEAELRKVADQLPKTNLPAALEYAKKHSI